MKPIKTGIMRLFRTQSLLILALVMTGCTATLPPGHVSAKDYVSEAQFTPEIGPYAVTKRQRGQEHGVWRIGYGEPLNDSIHAVDNR
jgi:hypothetical protein